MANTLSKTIQAAGTLLGWFALAGQLYLTLHNREVPVAATLIQYFSYFTILTNILVALCFTALLTGKGTFFRKAGTQAAIAVYILVVGLVYNLVLRFLWQPQGLQQIVDELLHTINPLLFLLHWLCWGNSKALAWKTVWPWLLYPLVYVVYTLIRGSMVHFYPYPFIDVDQLGYAVVLRNSLLLTFVFLGLSLLFVAVSRFRRRL